MPALSPAQIYAYARGAGLSPAAATTATAVALAESGGRPDAIGDVALENAKWGPSVGLWQIRSLKAQEGTGGPRDASQLTSPAFNAQSMAQISGTGSNFRAWTTFTSGAYRSHLSQVASTTPGAVITDTAGGSSGSGGSSSSSGQSVAASMGTGGLFGTGLFDWAPTAFTVAIKVVAGVAAAGLVLVGAVHTVSNT